MEWLIPVTTLVATVSNDFVFCRKTFDLHHCGERLSSLVLTLHSDFEGLNNDCEGKSGEQEKFREQSSLRKR